MNIRNTSAYLRSWLMGMLIPVSVVEAGLIHEAGEETSLGRSVHVQQKDVHSLAGRRGCFFLDLLLVMEIFLQRSN